MSVKNKKIKLMPDYDCWCLWNTEPVHDEDYNLNPNALPLSDNLKLDLSKWEELYDSTLNRNDPINSGFKTEVDQKVFDEIGLNLFQRLKQELSDFHIEYINNCVVVK